MLLAHPLVESGGLPLPPVVVATIGLVVVAGVARIGLPGSGGPDQVVVPADEDRLTPAGIAGRIAGVGLLGLAIVAGRTGVNEATRNIAPSLTVVAGWPVLILASALLGRVWERINPWDALARLLGPWTRGPAPDPDVRWALPSALVLVWYLAAFPGATRPRAVGAALALYTVYTLAGCLLVGRARWLGRAEVIGLFLGWVGRWRRRGLVAWSPPTGTHAVLGVLAGGLLFGALRPSRLWEPVWFRFHDWPIDLLGLAVCVGLGVGVLTSLERHASNRGGTPGTVAAAAVPMIAALAVALALTRARLLVAVQLLPTLASDPLGRGWDLFGTAGWAVHPNPLGPTGLVVAQVVVLMAGGVVGASIARRRVAAPDGNLPGRVAPAVTGIATILAAGLLSVTAI